MSAAPKLPVAIAALLDQADLAALAGADLAAPGGRARRVRALDGSPVDLWCGPDATRLATMLAFLAGRCGAPQPLVVAVAVAEPIPALLIPAGRGTPADRPEHLTDPGRVITAFAEQLSALHAMPVEGCPVIVDLDAVVGDAEARVEGGMVDPDTFDDAHLDLEPGELLVHARALVDLVRKRPAPPSVVVHGRYRLENLLLDATDRAGGPRLTALDRCGLGDPAVDLASAARSIVGRLGPEALPAFFGTYHGPEPDAVRLEAYALLEQLR